MPVSRPSGPFAFIENDAPLMDFRGLLPERLFEKATELLKFSGSDCGRFSAASTLPLSEERARAQMKALPKVRSLFAPIVF